MRRSLGKVEGIKDVEFGMVLGCRALRSVPAVTWWRRYGAPSTGKVAVRSSCIFGGFALIAGRDYALLSRETATSSLLLFDVISEVAESLACIRSGHIEQHN